MDELLLARLAAAAAGDDDDEVEDDDELDEDDVDFEDEDDDEDWDDDEDEEEEEDEETEAEEARMARVVGKIVEDLRAEFVRRTAPLETLPAAVVAALPPAPEAPSSSVDWRQATFALVAGKLVRRELAQLRKREADPTAAVARLEAFYRRFMGDALAELRPWLGQLANAEAAEAAAAHVIAVWADEAMQTCVAALQQNGGLGDVIRRWEIDREARLTRALMEAIDG
jgi:hypothetical protein